MGSRDKDKDKEGWRALLAPYSPAQTDDEDEDKDEDEDGSDSSGEDSASGRDTDGSEDAGLAELSRDLSKVARAPYSADALRSPAVATPRLVMYDESGVPVFLREAGEPLFMDRNILRTH